MNAIKIPNLIIGGGIAGITVAVELLYRRNDFYLLESSPRLGGKVESLSTDKAHFEFGPNALAAVSPEMTQLLERLNLTDSLVEANPVARHRYILKRGRPVQLPSKPPQILTTKALSLRGRLRFVSEIVYAPRKKKGEESVWDFFARHFGEETARYIADPFVSGIFAGDARQISVTAAFPTMAQAEARSPSLIRYLLSQRKMMKTDPRLYQLKGGLESIFRSAREKVGGERIHLNEGVVTLAVDGKKMRVVTDRAEYEADRVYLTSPAYVASSILEKDFPQISAELKKVDYAPVITAHLRVHREEPFPFQGFGLLIPSEEQRQILGTLWNSSSFPFQFHDDRHHYLTVYAGGAKNRKLIDLDDAVIHDLIAGEVENIFGLRRGVEFLHLRRHAQAIPQYILGYGGILGRIQELLSTVPGLKLGGNYLGGISLSKTVTHAAGLL
ncbi:MAG: protoporphyrinogen oxidase [Deltaproteobacteria bacterium]|nr:protoporphyrinogen oxidase [Deltaproteobacteria bacterium]